MVDCLLDNTLIVQNHKLGEHSNQVPTNKERYQRLGGKLIYLSHTCLDIYVVSIVSQFMHNPNEKSYEGGNSNVSLLKICPR